MTTILHILQNYKIEIYLGSMLIYTSAQMVWLTCRATILVHLRIQYTGSILLLQSIWIMLTKATLVLEQELPLNLVIIRFLNFMGFYLQQTDLSPSPVLLLVQTITICVLDHCSSLTDLFIATLSTYNLFSISSQNDLLNTKHTTACMCKSL